MLHDFMYMNFYPTGYAADEKHIPQLVVKFGNDSTFLTELQTNCEYNWVIHSSAVEAMYMQRLKSDTINKPTFELLQLLCMSRKMFIFN